MFSWVDLLAGTTKIEVIWELLLEMPLKDINGIHSFAGGGLYPLKTVVRKVVKRLDIQIIYPAFRHESSGAEKQHNAQ